MRPSYRLKANEMTVSPEPAKQPRLSEISGAQLFGILAFGAAGLLIGYLGLPWLAKSSTAVSFNPATLGLTADLFAYGTVLLACWFIAARPAKGGWKAVGFRGCDPSLLGIGGLLAFVWIAASAMIYSAAGIWETALAYGAEFIAPYRSDPIILFGLFILAGPVAALVEELLFRSILYGWLRRRLNIAVAAILSAIIFTAVHPSVFAAGAAAVFDMTLLAIFLALLFELSRSLWPGILCHALNNMLLLGLYLYRS